MIKLNISQPFLKSQSVFVELYKNVLNIVELIERAKQGKLKTVVLLDADNVVSQRHLMAGLVRSFYNLEHDCMKTNTIGSELIYSLSSYSNVYSN